MWHHFAIPHDILHFSVYSRQVVGRKPRCRSIANFPGFEPSRDVHGIPVPTSAHECPTYFRPFLDLLSIQSLPALPALFRMGLWD